MPSAALNLDVLSAIDTQRQARGYLTVVETLALTDRGNIVLDPFSTLIGHEVVIGRDNVFFPGVVLDCRSGGVILIGDSNEFFAGLHMAALSGRIIVGNDNEIGEGGATIVARQRRAEIIVGDRVRIKNGPTLTGRTYLGNGAQILGQICVDSCRLSSGTSYQDPYPDTRGGMLKGYGWAQNINVLQGQILVGLGEFRQMDVVDQSPAPRQPAAAQQRNSTVTLRTGHG